MTHRPFHVLEDMDRRVELAHQDMMKTYFDPETHPKAHKPVDEPVTDDMGEEFDIMTHTPDATAELLDPL